MKGRSEARRGRRTGIAQDTGQDTDRRKHSRVAQATLVLGGEFLAAAYLYAEKDDGVLAHKGREGVASAAASARHTRREASGGLERTAELECALLRHGDHGGGFWLSLLFVRSMKGLDGVESGWGEGESVEGDGWAWKVVSAEWP